MDDRHIALCAALQVRRKCRASKGEKFMVHVRTIGHYAPLLANKSVQLSGIAGAGNDALGQVTPLKESKSMYPRRVYHCRWHTAFKQMCPGMLWSLARPWGFGALWFWVCGWFWASMVLGLVGLRLLCGFLSHVFELKLVSHAFKVPVFFPGGISFTWLWDLFTCAVCLPHAPPRSFSPGVLGDGERRGATHT